jgi:hypothetical protein
MTKRKGFATGIPVEANISEQEFRNAAGALLYETEVPLSRYLKEKVGQYGGSL